MLEEEVGRSVAFDLLMTAITGIFFGLSLTYNPTARFVPLIIATPTFALALGQLVKDLAGLRAKRLPAGEAREKEAPGGWRWRKEFGAGGWVVLLLLMVWLLGFIVTIPLYIFLCLRVRSRESWLLSVIIPLVVWVFMYGLFVWLLKVQFDSGFLFDLLAK